MNEMTTRILEAIERHWREQGYSPSIRDLMEMASVSSESVVSYHLVWLARAGYIRRTPRVARSIVVLDREDHPICPMCGAEMMLRTKPAGDGQDWKIFWGCRYPYCKGKRQIMGEGGGGM